MGMMRLFMSTDTDAPRLSGTAGDAANLLDKLFVDGYNAKTLTSITRSGSTATATLTSHGFASDRNVRISGCDQPEYNGDFWVTVTSSSTFTFEVSGSPATPATTSGTIDAKVAPLDWTTTYTGSNIRSYQQGLGSNGFVLGLDDTGTTSCRVRGFESMTAAGVAVADGSGPFPTDAQTSGGRYWRKSSAASTAERWWAAFGDERTFYILSTEGSTTAASAAEGFGFGDANSNVVGDLFCTVMIADSSDSINHTVRPVVGFYARNPTFTSTAPYDCYTARAGSQTGGSVVWMRVPAGNISTTSSEGQIMLIGSAGQTYPSPNLGGLVMSRIGAKESNTAGLRGTLRGLWFPDHQRPLSNFDTFSGAAGSSLAGKRFMAVSVGGSGNGQLIFEIAGSW